DLDGAPAGRAGPLAPARQEGGDPAAAGGSPRSIRLPRARVPGDALALGEGARQEEEEVAMIHTAPPPGPRGLPVLGNLLEYGRDPLLFLRRVARDHGDVAKIQIGQMRAYLFRDPAAVEEVLVTQNRSLTKGLLGAQERMLFGNGLLTSEGDFWRR